MRSISFLLIFSEICKELCISVRAEWKWGKPRLKKKTSGFLLVPIQFILSSFSAQTTGMHFFKKKKYTNWEVKQKKNLSPPNSSWLFDNNVIYLDQRICFSRSSQYCPPNVIGTWTNMITSQIVISNNLLVLDVENLLILNCSIHKYYLIDTCVPHVQHY
jgi:hypothetical protein